MLGRKDLLPKETIVHKSTTIDLGKIQIPPLPAVVMKVLTFESDNPHGGSAEMEKILSPDIGISTNIIRIANSAYYGRSGTIQSLKDAITLLGTKTIKNLIFLEYNKKINKSLKPPLFFKHLR